MTDEDVGRRDARLRQHAMEFLDYAAGSSGHGSEVAPAEARTVVADDTADFRKLVLKASPT